MTVYYVDYQNGNDAFVGTNFASRKKTVHSAATLAVGGDEIRIMASPDPTLVGTGIVTDRPGMNSSIVIGSQEITFSGVTGFTTITMANHGFSEGDTIGIYGNTAGRFLDGTWEINNVTTNKFNLVNYNGVGISSGSGGRVVNLTQKRILLDTAVTQNIASFGPRTTPWTASTNVVTTLQTSISDQTTDTRYTEHDRSDMISPNATFTTGKAAFYTLPSTLDLSAYQQISLRVKHVSGNTNTSSPYSNYSLRLCTDTIGNTSVHTVNLPARGNNGTSSIFKPITVDFGTNLNSAIRSVALYIDTDLGAQQIAISNIIACKDSSSPDSLTLTSLVGLNTTSNNSNKEWYTIESINDRRILLNLGDLRYPPKATNGAGGSGAWFGNNAGSNNIYKRETIEVFNTSSSPADPGPAIRTFTSGTFASNYSNNIIISGGWDRTNMTTQTGMTYLDSRIYFGYGMVIAHNFISLSNIGIVRFFTNLLQGTGIKLENMVDFISCNGPNLETASGASVVGCVNVKLIAAGAVTGASLLNQGASWNDGTSPCDITFVGYIQRAYYSNGANARARFTRFNAFIGGGSDATIDIPTGNFSSDYVTIFPGGGSVATGAGIRSQSNNDIPGLQAQVDDQVKIGICTMGSVGTIGIWGRNASKISVKEHNYSTGRSSFGSYYGNVLFANYSLRADTGSRILVGAGGTVNRGVDIASGSIYLNNLQINASPEVSFSVASGGNLYSKNHDGVSGEFYNVLAGAYVITEDITTRHTASGYSWKIECVNQNYDAEFMIAKVAASASTSITFKLYCYRASSTGSNARLKVLGNNRIAGITSDTFSSGLSGAVNTWEELSLTITPSDDCVAEVFLVLDFSGTHTMYIDDFSVT